MNASANKSARYDRGKKSESSGKSINQLQKEVEQGKAPKEIKRFDKSHSGDLGQDHVHFKKTKSALNKDGTWKDGKEVEVNKDTKEYLKKNGWKVD